MNANRWLPGLLLSMMASAAVATTSAKANACQPKIGNAWVRAAPPGSMMLAGYASVENGCRKAVVIKSVTSDDFGMVMIHETVVENGISKMRHLDALTVPAKGSASFAPAGRHLMLMAPVRELKPGDKVSLKFVLADGKVILAEFALRRAMPAAEK